MGIASLTLKTELRADKFIRQSLFFSLFEILTQKKWIYWRKKYLVL